MRDKMKKSLGKRTQESHKNRDSGGGIKNYFNESKMEGVSTWWAGKGDHIIDIIPYIAGKHDPRNEEGEPSYVLDIEVHRYVGPMDDMVVCLEQYGKPCPICERSRELNREGADWKTEIKPLKPSRRAMYNVIVRDDGEMEKKGVQVFEIAHWFMERHLAKIAKDPRGGGFTVFSDPDEGKSISFERTGVGSENTMYGGHRFADRPNPISDEELDSAYCLDDLIEIKDYDEIYSIFYGESSDNEEDADDTEPNTSNEEIEDEEEAPPKRRNKSKKSKRKRAPKCPHGFVIGEDIDEYDECEECEKWDECNDIADAM